MESSGDLSAGLSLLLKWSSKSPRFSETKKGESMKLIFSICALFSSFNTFAQQIEVNSPFTTASLTISIAYVNAAEAVPKTKFPELQISLRLAGSNNCILVTKSGLTFPCVAKGGNTSSEFTTIYIAKNDLANLFSAESVDHPKKQRALEIISGSANSNFVVSSYKYYEAQFRERFSILTASNPYEAVDFEIFSSDLSGI